MVTNNSINLNATGIASYNGSGTFNGRTITGTTNQITITNGDGTAGNPTIAMSTNVVKSGQCAFLYQLQTSDTNVTGDGTGATLGASHALTQIFDQNSNCTTAGVFTAPVTAIYFLHFRVQATSLGSSPSNGIMQIVTTARTYNCNNINWFTVSEGNSTSLEMTAIANMTSGDTASCKLTVSGGTKVVGINGGTSGQSTFSGFLIT